MPDVDLKAMLAKEPPRMNAKTREAIELLVRTGMTQRWCAEQVGMNETAFGRALKKPHIAAYVEQKKLIAVQDLKTIRKMGEIAAYNVGIELMQNATSEAVKARMVEFFARVHEKKGAQVSVNIGNNGTTGYEMAKPNQRIVDIVDVTPDEEGEQT